MHIQPRKTNGQFGTTDRSEDPGLGASLPRDIQDLLDEDAVYMSARDFRRKFYQEGSSFVTWDITLTKERGKSIRVSYTTREGGQKETVDVARTLARNYETLVMEMDGDYGTYCERNGLSDTPEEMSLEWREWDRQRWVTHHERDAAFSVDDDAYAALSKEYDRILASEPPRISLQEELFRMDVDSARRFAEFMGEERLLG